MSLSRLALRLAAVEALSPSALAETGPYPTWAGNRVYDSRITPIADADAWQAFVEEIEGKPLVTVYTEEQEATPSTGEYPPDKEMVDLVVEIMIAAGASIVVDGPDGQPMEIGSLQARITDAQCEATLDQLEAQIRGLLDPMSPRATAPYIRIARELHHVKSAPVRDANRLSRQAARTLTFKLCIPQERYVAAANSAPADIAGLPEPLLSVARALEPSSPGGQLVRQIAKGQAPGPVLTPLRDVRIYTSVDRGAVPTEQTADLVSDQRL